MELFNPTLTPLDIEWFHTRYTKGSPDECWEWNYHKLPFGYGQTRIGAVAYYSHQIQYFLTYGAYDRSLLIRHKCDNPSCCNPSHLSLGTHIDNAQDKVDRNRQSRESFTLTDEEILEIHNLYLKGLTQSSIAMKYSLTQSFVSRVISGKRLRHQSERVGMKFAI